MKLVTILVMLLLITACAVESDVQTSDAPPPTSAPPTAVPPTATPKPIESVTAQELYDAREANATRFDDQYKGKTVRVSGQVVTVEDGDVTLGIDLATASTHMALSACTSMTSRRKNRSPSIRANRYPPSAKLGNYIIGTMMMKKCKLDAPTDDVAVTAPQSKPTAPAEPQEPHLSLWRLQSQPLRLSQSSASTPALTRLAPTSRLGVYAGTAGQISASGARGDA